MKTIFLMCFILLGAGLLTIRCGSSDFAALFSDDFNRANGDLASASWSVKLTGGGTATINSNRAYLSQSAGASPTAIHQTAGTTTSLKASVKVIVSGGASTAPVLVLILRRSSANASETATSYGCGFFGGTTLTLKENDTALATATTAQSFADGTEFTLTVVQDGNTLACGTTATTITATATTLLTGQYQGLIAGETGNNVIYLDDFAVSGK